ncbi:hypothetical protein ACJRO7_022966 [Eucalyptus globulus]|uniref:Uncharacterized protein n=1 Tax=Eucalyptus globulus TaxID=34317 RepID=A0ABD3K550_EUCGL
MASCQPISAASLPLHVLLSAQPALSSRETTVPPWRTYSLYCRSSCPGPSSTPFAVPCTCCPPSSAPFFPPTAWLEFHNNTGSKFGGGTPHIKVSKAHSWTCMDIYVFATPYCHTFEFKEWEGKAEFEYVKSRGVSIFLMQAGMLGTLQALWDVFPCFQIPGEGRNLTLVFSRSIWELHLSNVPSPWLQTSALMISTLETSLQFQKFVESGGGFGTLEKWVSGAYASHTAVCLRDAEGKLWVGESGHDNEQGEDVIAVLPWENGGTAAWEFAQIMNGKPYGYHNMLFSWIDTIGANYPAPLDAHVVQRLYTCIYVYIYFVVQPAYAANIWNEGLDLPNLIHETEMRGSSFAELDGKSASCVAFVLEMYKAAGLFDPISSSIHVTEFTIKDAYSLRCFEDHSSGLPKWCDDGDDVELLFYQLRGWYRMELPGYNTVDLYPHMNEMCPSLAPKYSKPSSC